MPDVIGDGLLLARGVLEGKGLDLRVETEASEQPSDTVLATNPSPGVMVRTGTIVRVTVASQGAGDTTLLPLNLQGVAVTIDPAVVPKGQYGRRARGRQKAQVAHRSVGRDRSCHAFADRHRSGRVGPDSCTPCQGGLCIGRRWRRSRRNRPEGHHALYPLTGSNAVVEPSRTLATGIATALVANGLSGSAATVASDPVLTVTKAPWSRVRLGSLAAPEDVANFKDPKWADGVARSIYRSIAENYGVKGATR